MKTIDRIRDEINIIVPPPWDRRIALLVEYYEAAEGEFKYVGISGDTPMNRRLKQARARLEKEDE